MNSTVSGSDERFDFIVVGAGSAGAALANRLTADGTATVALLEAGGPDKKTEIHIPAAFSALFRSEFDWNYDTEPQPGLDGRSIYWPRGKVLGGSSSLNAMMWVRGYAADYDRWAELAGPGWSWKALLPYFRKAERVAGNTDPDQGSDGAVNIEPQRSPRSHTAAFLQAVREAGLPVVPPNTAQPDGFSQTMLTQHRGARFSTVDAYLKPARGRGNLSVRTGAHATRVLFDGKRAIGVEYLLGGSLQRVMACREVVLSGGAVNTPQLLMLSGIGDAKQLRAVGIDVLVDSPEVGANLADHLMAGLAIASSGDTLFSAQKPAQLINYLLRRRGMLTSNVAEAYGFIKTKPEFDHPDVELLFAPVGFVGEGLIAAPGHALTMGAILLQPKSRGTVGIKSKDPLEKALIDPQYLSDPGGEDKAALLAGLALCERLLSSSRLSGGAPLRFVQPLGAENLDTVARDELAITRHAQTLYHPTSTARMGSDDRSVVDPELRVRGIERLRVADASIMPRIIRGHTNAPSIVIGEKAADLLHG